MEYKQRKRDQIIHHLEKWVMTHIHRPIKGFEQKKNYDGTLFTKHQQLSSTRLQVLSIGMYFIDRGKSPEEVFAILQPFL